jgi:AcrR family transcriptional regulator
VPKTGLSPDDLREKALDVALEQMRVHGFEKVRLSAVARAMGVSHAALYAYFTDKEALLDGVTERWLAYLDQRTAAVLAAEDSAEAKLRNWFLLRYAEKRAKALSDPEPYRAYAHAASAEKAFFAGHLAQVLGQLTALLRQAGLGGEAEARLLYDAMIAFNHPAMIIAQARQDRTEDLKTMLDLMMAGLRAKPAAAPPPLA